MADTTTIEWTRNDDGTPGRTWNPATGCTKISSGCDNCYAETIAERFRGHAAFPHGFDVQIRANKVNDPLSWRKPTRVFVNSMSDLFHDQIDREWIAEIFGVMAAAQKHTFQLLTKRHGRMRSLLNDPSFVHKVRHRAEGKGLPVGSFTWPLPNLWLGVSVENQQWADIRIPALLDTPAAIRFLSCEPLLGAIDLKMPVDHSTHERDYTDGMPWPQCLDCSTDDTSVDWTAPSGPRISWLITGGESGRNARPAHPDWFRSLRDQCTDSGIAYFHKQNGEWQPLGPLYGDLEETDQGHMEAVDLEVMQGKPVIQLESDGYVVEGHQPADSRTWLMGRVGKKAAGRELDGREWNEFPAVTG